eukprot:9908-Heterococcus_DN1.PRE.1
MPGDAMPNGLINGQYCSRSTLFFEVSTLFIAMNTAHSVHASCCCAISAHVLPLLCADAYRLRDRALLHTKPTLKHVLTILCLTCAHVTMLYGSDAAVVDESFVLPAVTALRGVPEVTEAGDIVYTFPELQVSCSHTTTANLHANTNTSTTATTACSTASRL